MDDDLKTALNLVDVEFAPDMEDMELPPGCTDLATHGDPDSVGFVSEFRDYLDDDETDCGSEDSAWQVRTIERFRRRLAVAEASVARVAIGGVVETAERERPSGIVEDLVLSLALGKPVYLVGGCGGAAAEVGRLLGLAAVRTGRIPDSLRRLPPPRLEAIADRLRPPPYTRLPVTPLEQAEFLRTHAIGGLNWPPNGLSTDHNRELFATEDPHRAAELIRRPELTSASFPGEAWRSSATLQKAAT